MVREWIGREGEPYAGCDPQAARYREATKAGDAKLATMPSRGLIAPSNLVNCLAN